MIEDSINIRINASPSDVFDWIDRMPNKFPIYELLEIKPIVFVRILLVDGLDSAREAMTVDFDRAELRLDVGDTMGPFTLAVKERPKYYGFSLESLFFKCDTGYCLTAQSGGTDVSFDLIAKNPTAKEKLWWFFVKPIHRLFGKKVLRVIKEQVEQGR